MATNVARGDAAPIAQKNTVTVGGTPGTGIVYSVTINRKVVSYTALVSDTNTTIAAALQLLLAASTYAEFAEVTWTQSGAVITGTARVPGKPFTSTSSATSTGTLVTATTVASKGPNHWDDPTNWTLNAIPVSTNDVIVPANVNLYYGIDQNAVAPASLTLIGNVGLPSTNANGYTEYRERYLKISSPIVTVGDGSNGPNRSFLDLSSTASAITVLSTTSPASNGTPAITINGTASSSTLQIFYGYVNVATDPGSTATITSLDVTYQSLQTGDVVFKSGAGCTLTTVTQSGGTVQHASDVTTYTLNSGTCISAGEDIDVTTFKCNGGTLDYRSNGTITTMRISGTVDVSRDLRGKTFTNTTIEAGGVLRDPNSTITFTNPIQLAQCDLDKVELLLGPNRTIAPG